MAAQPPHWRNTWRGKREDRFEHHERHPGVAARRRADTARAARRRSREGLRRLLVWRPEPP